MVNPAYQRARFLAPGDKLGKHDLIRQIAVGGMAELYLARTMGLEGFEKLVVLKRILPQYAGSSSFVNMFLNEARLAATLHHPNIAQVFDIDQDGADYFFSMEYVHGQDLGHLVASANESGVPISLDAALTLVAGLCAGLHYAHEKVGPDGRPLHVVHRDVSPSNVLVSYDGAVKLVDFGIARAGSTPATTRGGLKGKIAYMSPEQCRGKASLDRRSDVFSIGTILYELTTGRLPFTDETEYGILNQIVNRDAEPPGRLVTGYPPALEAIAMRALARDPDQRYATALEMQKDVEDFAHENRLRVSPLVLARLMGTLYPTRLEEWDHARAQGAFFVEQHVVRTLIESGKGDGDGEGGADAAPAAAADNDTLIGPPPSAEDPTSVQAGGRARAPVPLPGMPPPHTSDDAATAPVRASSPAIGQPPRRPSDPAMQGGRGSSPAMQGGRGSSPAMQRGRASSPAIRAATPAPGAPGAVDAQPPPPGRMPTPAPVRMPTPVPVPGQPGAVPIVAPGAAPLIAGPPMLGASSLVTSQTGSNPALMYPTRPVMDMTDVTERVRAPRAPVMPVETTLVKIGRSRTPVIVLVATGVLAAAVAVFIVFGGGEAATRTPAVADPPAQPRQVDPATADDPAKAADSAAAATADDPAKAAGSAAGAATADDPEQEDEDEEAAQADDPAKEPATAKAGAPKTAKKPPRTRQGTRTTKQTRGTSSKKDPRKPDPGKESKWTPDSPFMPVRTDKK
ncbi:MAG TPA: protein kinase [Kofleriaceae bacterium]|nr:protein kinase [Kofleriaceae bacterium]